MREKQSRKGKKELEELRKTHFGLLDVTEEDVKDMMKKSPYVFDKLSKI